MQLPQMPWFLAYDPGIAPAEGGLPGLDVLKTTMNSINLFAIIAIVGALCVSAVVWGWGHFSASHGAEANGKKGVLISVGAALLLGAANGIVAFFTNLGTQVH
ncbi:DUF6112 family protein [Streptomyces carpaticus]|uniref:DUF6112 family protein n=1 Tax=Streptomyces carpaticus TaxID=285558 RepID=UPI0021FC13F4|nr:DUF6112 family protein [Streptomyces carpaticus]